MDIWLEQGGCCGKFFYSASPPFSWSSDRANRLLSGLFLSGLLVVLGWRLLWRPVQDTGGNARPRGLIIASFLVTWVSWEALLLALLRVQCCSALLYRGILCCKKEHLGWMQLLAGFVWHSVWQGLRYPTFVSSFDPGEGGGSSYTEDAGRVESRAGGSLILVCQWGWHLS